MSVGNTDEFSDKLSQISEAFMKCSKALTAIGDETRQRIIVALLECGCSKGKTAAVTGAGEGNCKWA